MARKIKAKKIRWCKSSIDKTLTIGLFPVSQSAFVFINKFENEYELTSPYFLKLYYQKLKEAKQKAQELLDKFVADLTEEG